MSSFVPFPDVQPMEYDTFMDVRYDPGCAPLRPTDLYAAPELGGILPDPEPAEQVLLRIEMQPLRDKLLVELVEVQEGPESSLFLDATVDSPVEYGRIVAMGPGIEDPRLQVGSVVQFGKFSGYALQGERSMLVREADLNAIVTGGRVITKAEKAATAADGVRKIIEVGPVSPAEERRMRGAEDKRQRRADRNRKC